MSRISSIYERVDRHGRPVDGSAQGFDRDERKAPAAETRRKRARSIRPRYHRHPHCRHPGA